MNENTVIGDFDTLNLPLDEDLVDTLHRFETDYRERLRELQPTIDEVIQDSIKVHEMT